jgi:hypothetical protein
MSVLFRSVLDSETERLETLCQDWLHFLSSTDDLLPLEASGVITASVGQTQLLLKKFHQLFKGLIDRWEKTLELSTMEAPVMWSDHSGFGDICVFAGRGICSVFIVEN